MHVDLIQVVTNNLIQSSFCVVVHVYYGLVQGIKSCYLPICGFKCKIKLDRECAGMPLGNLLKDVI